MELSEEQQKSDKPLQTAQSALETVNAEPTKVLDAPDTVPPASSVAPVQEFVDTTNEQVSIPVSVELNEEVQKPNTDDKNAEITQELSADFVQTSVDKSSEHTELESPKPNGNDAKVDEQLESPIDTQSSSTGGNVSSKDTEQG